MSGRAGLRHKADARCEAGKLKLQVKSSSTARVACRELPVAVTCECDSAFDMRPAHTALVQSHDSCRVFQLDTCVRSQFLRPRGQHRSADVALQ